MSLTIIGRVRPDVAEDAPSEDHVVEITITEEDIIKLIEEKAYAQGLKARENGKGARFLFASILEIKHRVNTF